RLVANFQNQTPSHQLHPTKEHARLATDSISDEAIPELRATWLRFQRNRTLSKRQIIDALRASMIF
ncbi:unnamed protein product, partial [marine sediment metagenome]